jgi:inhibitor of KinA
MQALTEAKIRQAGEGGLVVIFGEKIAPGVHERVQGFIKSLRQLEISAIREIVPSYCSVMIYFDVLEIPGSQMRHLAERALRELEPVTKGPSKVLHVPVCYDGVMAPDLDNVLRLIGLTRGELLKVLTSRPYLVYLTGFSPGFPYMGNLPFSVPRQASPRRAVPVGSVGLGGNQTGIYTVTVPGEWNIIGRTPLKIFDAGRPEPFLLSAGDYVQFEEIDIGQYFKLRRQVAANLYLPQTSEEEVRA